MGSFSSEPVSTVNKLLPLDAIVASSLRAFSAGLHALDEVALPLELMYVQSSSKLSSSFLDKVLDRLYAGAKRVYPQPHPGDITTRLQYGALPPRVISLIGTDIIRTLPVLPNEEDSNY